MKSTRHLLKNKWYFYELGTRQPKSDQSLLEPLGRQVFDPLRGLSSESMESRVKKVFGELGSRESSRREAELKGTRVLGIKVPARPEEPTNCCQSGCVNCVWELYKDEIDEWRQARRKAQRLLMRPENLERPWPPQLGREPSGRHSAEPEEHHEEDDGLDVGIKAFIETEKRLHAKRAARKVASAKAGTPEASNP